MISRIYRKFRFISLRNRVGTLEQFRKAIALHDLTAASCKKNMERLRPVYNQYVNEVSSPDMAASLELAAFLLTTCQLKGYRKLLDLGSGFSSFVFRLYAKETPGVIVFSVDDNVSWLKKTRMFLLANFVEADRLITMEEFQKTNEVDFDCVLHDLNLAEGRIDHLDQIMQLISKEGLVILDDLHKPDYLMQVLSNLENTSHKIFSLEPITLDSYGRFSMGVIKFA